MKTRQIVRYRRTAAEMAALRQAIYDIVKADHPMTVRQVFYQLVGRGIIAKAESEYKKSAARQLLKMRRRGMLPYSWIADNTRWMRKPTTFSGWRQALEDTKESYRRMVWHDLDVAVEVWCEKDALAGVIYQETAPFDVPLMVTRGFASESYLYEAAEAIKNSGKKATYIYYFGDHDPSGRRIDADVERRLRGFAPKAKIIFKRVAVTPAQTKQMRLPTRPTKTKGNTHAANFTGESVELDAIAAGTLRRLVRQCIERHIPAGHMENLEAAEASEREILAQILRETDV